MMRFSRMADFAIVVMTELAQSRKVKTAAELAEATQLPAPAVAKILARLCREKLLTSIRGVKGGYGLNRPSNQISIGNIVSALDGPVALTKCIKGSRQCEVEPLCPSRMGLHRINMAVQKALEDVSLAEVALPVVGVTGLEVAGTSTKSISGSQRMPTLKT